MRLPPDHEAFSRLFRIKDRMLKDEIRSCCPHILTFGVIPEVTGEVKEQLVKELRDSHYGFLMNSHNGTVNSEEDCFIFNVTPETMEGIATRHQLDGFYLCDVRGEGEMCRHYEKQSPEEPAHKSKNPYVLREERMELNIPMERFKEINTQLSENLKQFDNDPDIIERTMTQVGEYPWNVRRKIYDKLF